MKWEEYAQRWPNEIDEAFKGLNSSLSKGIFVYLLLNGKKTYTELLKDLEIKSNNLSYHLKTLSKSGLISHTYAYEQNRQDHSLYSVSNFGNTFAKKCLEAAHHPYEYQLPPEIKIPTQFEKSATDMREMPVLVTTQEVPTIELSKEKPEQNIKRFKISVLTTETDENIKKNINLNKE
jgi:DNA-binding HxlR family transcriptional regulator